jgi:hypothetical protein
MPSRTSTLEGQQVRSRLCCLSLQRRDADCVCLFIFYFPPPRLQPAPPSRTHRKIVALPPQSELLALQSYLLASPHNGLPRTIDPSKPLDTEAILGHRVDEAAIEELERDVDPVVVWASSEV